MTHPFEVTQRPVGPEPLLDGVRYDYADCFQVQLTDPDTHSAEVWVRTALEQAPAAVAALIRVVHSRILRFRLAPPAAGNLLGWHVDHEATDVYHLVAAGPLLRAGIIARAVSPTAHTLTTYLVYERPQTRYLWLVIGPLHRLIARRLLIRAATALTSSGPVGPTGRPAGPAQG
jgi:hypothetical protein